MIGADRDPRGDIVNIAERTSLRRAAEDRHSLATHQLVHEDSDDVAVTVTNVLSFSIDITWTKDYVIQLELRVRGPQVQLDRVFGNSVWVFGMRRARSPPSHKQ